MKVIISLVFIAILNYFWVSPQTISAFNARLSEFASIGALTVALILIREKYKNHKELK